MKGNCIMKKRISVLLVLILLMNCFSVTSFASENQLGSKVNTKFDYSFAKQDSWKDKPRNEKLESCQIPNNTANKMTTEALLDSILENPFTVDMLAYDSLEEGYQKVKEEIFAFKNLLDRSDLGNILVNKYSMSCEGTSDIDIMNSLFLSVMIAQPEIEKKINEVDLKSFENSLKVKDKHLYKSSKEEHADSTITLLSGYTTVWTPNGSHIEVYEYTGSDYTVAQQQSMHNYFTGTYRFQSYVSPASRRYNCHSYAWYSQSTSNPYWMNTPYCDAYMNDGSYYNVATPTANDRVHWHNGDHSGIIVYVGSQAGNVSVISKYGEYGVYQAFIGDVTAAYSGSSYTFWRR